MGHFEADHRRQRREAARDVLTRAGGELHVEAVDSTRSDIMRSQVIGQRTETGNMRVELDLARTVEQQVVVVSERRELLAEPVLEGVFEVFHAVEEGAVWVFCKRERRRGNNGG